MGDMKRRGTRALLDGTGFYIALFLGVTALAVTGYWMLFPSHTQTEVQSAAKPQELPVPLIIEPVEPVIVEKEEPVKEEAPPKPIEKAPDVTPVAPTLIVSYPAARAASSAVTGQER